MFNQPSLPWRCELRPKHPPRPIKCVKTSHSFPANRSRKFHYHVSFSQSREHLRSLWTRLSPGKRHTIPRNDMALTSNLARRDSKSHQRYCHYDATPLTAFVRYNAETVTANSVRLIPRTAVQTAGRPVGSSKSHFPSPNNLVHN